MSSQSHSPQELPSPGAVATYLHAGGKIGVLVEVSCETDSAARTDAFQRLIHDLAMHVAAVSPKFIRREHVSAEIVQREKDIFRSQLASSPKPPQVMAKIFEGKIHSFMKRFVFTSSRLSKTRLFLSPSSLLPSRMN